MPTCPARSPHGSYACDRPYRHGGRHQAAITHPSGSVLGTRIWDDRGWRDLSRPTARSILAVAATVIIVVALLAILMYL